MARLALQLAGAVTMAAALPLAIALWLASRSGSLAILTVGWLIVTLWATGGLFWNARARPAMAVAALVLGGATSIAFLVAWADDAHVVLWMALGAPALAVVPLALLPLAPRPSPRPNP
jgi:hypothetical protein